MKKEFIQPGDSPAGGGGVSGENEQDILAGYMFDILDSLSQYGAGAPGEGITRLLYSPAWLEAQLFLAERMRAAGLEVRFDRVGNLYGRLQGSEPGRPVVAAGSHVDTVKQGGKYDGALGIAASLAAVSYLKECYGVPKRTLEVVSFCEEEGSRFPFAYWGSGSVTGERDLQRYGSIRDGAGVTLQEAMEQAGFGRAEQADPLRRDLGAYLELHIEQGIMLEREGADIGIVETIVGQRRYTAQVTGETNHAGTTPMRMRSDALAGAAEMVVALERMALEEGPPLVATVGRLEVSPNTSNVIPGRVSFSLDIRHESGEKLQGFCGRMSEAFAGLAAARGLKLELQLQLATAPAPMDAGLGGRLERLCSSRGISCRRMVSGAGHDAQLLAAVCPAAMLFVPSRGGISHAPEEYTAPEHLARGTELLAALLRELAYGDNDEQKGER
ncbi:allantoate amidohydrolase [Paenibacillus yonginensis]|uniref:Allantoate amidohydrolase n=1 Tax=Paenibacillus yonginensis TaxID=1462996 RepID=A0A1B1MVV9_9BACL|nr:Zn-dependent hydrolase [Paenibacillus yonginensis]ANS73322.1 allantoate amidohydrolase [Paenibacillus yonginensis]